MWAWNNYAKVNKGARVWIFFSFEHLNNLTHLRPFLIIQINASNKQKKKYLSIQTNESKNVREASNNKKNSYDASKDLGHEMDLGQKIFIDIFFWQRSSFVHLFLSPFILHKILLDSVKSISRFRMVRIFKILKKQVPS